MCRGMPATAAIFVTIRYASRRSIGWPVSGLSTSGPLVRCTAAGLEHAEHRDGDRHCCGLVALADQAQDAVTAQRLPVILDPHSRRFGGAQGVDAEQVRQRAVVDADGLGDLQEPDQLKPVQALGAGLVALHLRQPGVHGGVGRDQPVDVRELEVATDTAQHRHHG